MILNRQHSRARPPHGGHSSPGNSRRHFGILRRLSHVLHGLLLVVLLPATGSNAAPRKTGGMEALGAAFAQPPAAFRPWVYWMWLNGNVTRNGITADLEAMQRVGIGGVLIMDVDQGAPQGPIRFASADWRGLFQHACLEAKRLGMEINMNNDAGWCGSGAPWITPELSMQKVVWSETHLSGPALKVEPLPQPPATRGFYRDIAVLAFPTPTGEEERMEDHSPTFTTSGPAPATDKPGRTFRLPKAEPDRPSWLQIDFPTPQTARELCLTLGLSGDQFCHGMLQCSEDGATFRDVTQFVADGRRLVLDFPAVTSRHFRILFHRQHPDIQNILISSPELSPRLRIPNIDAKAGFRHSTFLPGPRQFPILNHYPEAPQGCAIPHNRVLNLTSQLRKDGQLDWQPPAGNWTILRIGHTSTGVDNHPAPEGGLGLECDKLNKEGIRAVFGGFLEKLVRENRHLAPGALVAAHVDSWEVGSQNWTARFPAEFKRRRGYDLTSFLPALTGRPVEDLEQSERFLWDFRQTIADLLVDNYAGELRRLARQHGLRFSLEGYDAPCDDLTYAGQADEPMAEFWTWPPYEMDTTCTEMGSVGHVYGRPVIGAEAFTATSTERWTAHPFTAKPYGDWAFCEGINRLVVHRYAMQPWTSPDRKPGMTLGPFGLHYERTTTWWEHSRPWHEYLTRCQFLLRQGLYVADVCFLTPQTVPLHWRPPFDIRDRIEYGFDACPPEVVLKRMSAKDGRISLPDGMSYRLLVLPDSTAMTPDLLEKVRDLVRAGATVVGRPPAKSPSLANHPECDVQVKSLAAELWGSQSLSPTGDHRLGKGRVIWGRRPQQVLADDGIPPDFHPLNAPRVANLRYIHRTLPAGDVYFVANPRLERVETLCEFRVANRKPELWWPDSGMIEHPAIHAPEGGITRLPLRLEPGGSVFVIFHSRETQDQNPPIALLKDGKVLIDCANPDSAQTAAPAAVAQPVPTSAPTQDATNSTFTMAVWVRPAVDIPLPEESNTGQASYMLERNDAIFPPPGHEIPGGPDHAGAGLSIGRNGLCVFEHAPFHFPPVLVHNSAITNWTHITIVYEHGKPKLYLNGILAREGRQSDYIVHSGVGLLHRRGTAPFQGSLGEFQGLPRALQAEEVLRLMREMPVPTLPPEFPAVELTRKPAGDLQATVWEAGRYGLKTLAGAPRTFEVPSLPQPVVLDGRWDLSFPPDSGAPPSIQLDRLVSWSQHPEPGVQHFSGTATYRKVFSAPQEPRTHTRKVCLDLGQVSVMARVRLNGKDLGILWKPPYRIDVTAALRPGDNELLVEVVNLWVNRMIGDEQLPGDSLRNTDGTLKEWPDWIRKGQPAPGGRQTFTTGPLWKGDEPLRESGLLGPVRLLSAECLSLGRPH